MTFLDDQVDGRVRPGRDQRVGVVRVVAGQAVGEKISPAAAAGSGKS